MDIYIKHRDELALVSIGRCRVYGVNLTLARSRVLDVWVSKFPIVRNFFLRVPSALGTGAAMQKCEGACERVGRVDWGGVLVAL